MATLVNRATSAMLSGPDWAMNMELCDLVHNDPGITKDAIKAVKKRMSNKNAKVQLLSLTVLETMIKNCGDVVHHQVAAKGVLHDMVKIAKKNKDPQVRDKILLLLDTWQEGFGGPNGRYPQYFLAYDELRHSGAIFPRRTDNATPMFTPPQTHPIVANFPSPPRSPSRMTAETNSSRPSDLPALSLSDIHNARSGMEVLAEMLNAIDPRNKQALRDEVIMELVEQCQTAERRVVQLVNTTSDEELLRQGLCLNDDLKRVLAKYDAIASGAPLPREPPSAPSFLIDHETKDDSDDVLSQLSHRSTARAKASSSASGSSQLALPAPVQSQPQPQNKMAPAASASASTVDLLTGDSFNAEPSPAAPPTTLPIVQNLQASLSTLSLQGGPSLLSNGAGFQSPPGPPFYSNHQSQQSNLQYNGMVSGQFQRPPDANNYGQMPGQFNSNNYVVPWAQPTGFESNSFQQVGPEQIMPQSSGAVLNPQQAALIYGSSHPASQHTGMPLSPQQRYATEQVRRPEGNMYTAQVPSMAPSIPSQGYNSSLQPQQPLYMSTQVPPEHIFNPGSYPHAISAPSHQSLSPQSVNSHLPPAPWIMESSEAQQPPALYGNAMVPSFSVQSPDRQQLFLQQPYPSSGQFSSYMQSNMGQVQSLPSQGPSSYYASMQQSGLYMQQSQGMMFQNQVVPRKEEKAEDKLFKDLVDMAKVKKAGASSKG